MGYLRHLHQFTVDKKVENRKERKKKENNIDFTLECAYMFIISVFCLVTFGKNILYTVMNEYLFFVALI